MIKELRGISSALKVRGLTKESAYLEGLFKRAMRLDSEWVVDTILDPETGEINLGELDALVEEHSVSRRSNTDPSYLAKAKIDTYNNILATLDQKEFASSSNKTEAVSHVFEAIRGLASQMGQEFETRDISASDYFDSLKSIKDLKSQISSLRSKTQKVEGDIKNMLFTLGANDARVQNLSEEDGPPAIMINISHSLNEHGAKSLREKMAGYGFREVPISNPIYAGNNFHFVQG